MPYTQEQLDAALERLEEARADWNESVKEWNENFVQLPCYTGVKYPATDAATWFTPTDSTCTAKGSCTHADKKACKEKIKEIRSDIIPPLRARYIEWQAAEKNYKEILANLETEIGEEENGNGNGNGISPPPRPIEEDIKNDIDKKTNKYIIFGIIAIVTLILGAMLIKKIK